MPITTDLGRALDREWEDKTLDEILDAPVTAIAGISEGDGELLQQAFGIRTVRDLGTNKHFAVAGALAALSRHAD